MKHEEAIKISEQALTGLAQSLERGNSDGLKQFLEVMSRFPKYSFRNVMLIMAQRPDASHVAGFHTWRKLGRCVLKGEKGMGIVAPMVGRKAADDLRSTVSDVAESDDARLFGFRVVHVFDISQTEGAELPELARPQGDPGQWLGLLEDTVRRLNITLVYEPLPDASDGWSLKGKIIIRPDLAPAETFAVLVHELAHELMHTKDENPRPSKTVRETEAEAVAHAVCHACGIDTSASSSYPLNR